jgi:hypothetical protein
MTNAAKSISKMTKQSTAGKGTPYWYEWTVGLLKVTEMLYPENGIESVRFQATGFKGWDDVVVSYKDGLTEYIQVKHSRTNTNITFGSFVTEEKEEECLLRNLYASWRNMKLSAKTARCIVFTNREAGDRSYGNRPPLFDFVAWLRKESTKPIALSAWDMPQKWKEAWAEWLSRMDEGTDEDRLDFLRAFDVQPNRPDLDALGKEVVQRLADLFGTTLANATPLLQAFDNALRRWTTEDELVTAEEAFDALVLSNEINVPHRAPAPPAPFFPTREQEACNIEVALTTNTEPKVLFLSAAPGAGKTSLLSRIECRRAEKPLSGIVGLRYFAFLPLTPESPIVPVDADQYVRPENLWFGLLSEFRGQLRGKLWAYKVPVRNALLTWQTARLHVLRIADIIGTEIGHPFVIVIDGIDHAARAGRYEPGIARDFFASLPGPDELRDKNIRLFIAGQPPEHYPEYPVWLRTPHPDVKRLDLNPLSTADIAALFRHAAPPIPIGQWDEAVHTITVATNGNTLGVVFAVAEAARCKTAQELSNVLSGRQLRDGLQSYYESIWRYAFSTLSQSGPLIGIETALAGTLSVIRERVTGGLMAQAFQSLDLTQDKWHLLLAQLGPLIVSETDGFRVLHNDVRVFLARYLSAQPETNRKWVASMLANYYLDAHSNRRAAHESLLPLLSQSGRRSEWARQFTVSWVFEAAALDLPVADVWPQCEAASRAVCELRDWDVVHELACAVETLGRWQEWQEYISSDRKRNPTNEVPLFPPSELIVLPLSKWNVQEIQQLVNDVTRILDSHDRVRAFAVLERWLTGLTLVDLANRLISKSEPESPHGDPQRLTRDSECFVGLGSVCRRARYHPNSGKAEDEHHRKAVSWFEQGWIETSCATGPYNSINRCLDRRIPGFIGGYTRAMRALAALGHWRLVGRLLQMTQHSAQDFPSDFQITAAWWCLRSRVEKRCPNWLKALNIQKIASSYEPLGGSLEAPLAMCRARGWCEPSTHPSTIAEQVLAKLEKSHRLEKSGFRYRLLFRTAAVLGRLASLAARSKLDAARDLFPPTEMKQLAGALWNDDLAKDMDFHPNCGIAGNLALELVCAVQPLSDAHAQALTEAGRPIAERFGGGFQRESLWELFRRTGDSALLRTWIYRILGHDGWIWENVDSSSESDAVDYLRLARELGEAQLADAVERRLRWMRIRYRSHKEYSFRWPCTWFEDLTAIEPTAWRTHGVRLMQLCEACYAQNGDNRWMSSVNEALGAAAIGSGPDDARSFLLADQPACGTDRWLDWTIARYVNGLCQRSSREPRMSLNEKLATWCFAVALTRWYDNDDIACISALRKGLLDSCETSEQRQSLMNSILNMTPGEAVREPVRDQSDSVESRQDHKNAEPDQWRTRLTAGFRLTPQETLAAVHELVENADEESQKLLQNALESFGTENSFSGGWGSTEETKKILIEILGLISEAMKWALVKAALYPVGRHGYWWTSIAENLQMLSLARANSHGVTTLHSGLKRILDMHEKWARGGDLSLALPSISPAPSTQLTTWDDFSANLVVFLFSSRSAEVIKSATFGLQALVSLRPALIPQILILGCADDWTTKWLLNAAEVWAVTYPDHLRKGKEYLSSVLAKGPLRLRLQAWVVSCLLADRIGEQRPEFVFLPGDKSLYPSEIELQIDNILVTPPEIHGSIRFVDRYASTRDTIDRTQTTTGMDFTEVENRTAKLLLQLPKEDRNSGPWPRRITNRIDTYCSGESASAILDSAFDISLMETKPPQATMLKFAQGYLTNEDPWVLRLSPPPDPNPAAWPTDDFLAGRTDQPTPSAPIKEKLRLIALENGISHDEIVIAAEVKTFSWREDFNFRSWWDCRPFDGRPPVMPSTLSGRTFPLMLRSKFWQPRFFSLAFRVGGLQWLTASFPEIFPSSLWTDEFGWQVARHTPFVWFSDNKPAVQFQIYHGPVYGIRPRGERQPIVHRWVAKRWAWENISSRISGLNRHDEFERIASDAER